MKRVVEGVLCGVWVEEGKSEVWRYYRNKGGEVWIEKEGFRPFLWASEVFEYEYEREVRECEGKGTVKYLMEFGDIEGMEGYLKGSPKLGEGVEVIKPYESQYLIQSGERLFEGMVFEEIKRCQLDIETVVNKEGEFSVGKGEGDRVLAIGLRVRGENRMLVLDEESDAGEKRLLEEFNRVLGEIDPDVIEGHNIFKFDLEYLRQRCKRHKVKCVWGRFGAEAKFRNSRLKVAERWIDFVRCDIPGRTVFDTYLMIQLYDLAERALESYSLKAVALALGITAKNGGERVYLGAKEIGESFRGDRERFLAYLGDDLRETEGLGDMLLPTYVAQVKYFPMTLQEVALRGTGTKVDVLFLEAYYKGGHSLPIPGGIGEFEGGYTRSFRTGVYWKVMSFDVASLYPSLLMHMGRNPSGDDLGVFMGKLKELRGYRLEYKKKAREEGDVVLRREYEARQATFKIVINSFYGYLGFEGGRFADGELAGEVTRAGRELLQGLIGAFEREGCVVLEADTDGLYVSGEGWGGSGEELLRRVSEKLPDGVVLEYEGEYEAMFCYKAKNYALVKDGELIIRGSGLRSRGIEPYLRELTQVYIKNLLGLEKIDFERHVGELKERIMGGEMAVGELGKSERLSQSLDAYVRGIDNGGKARRAALEVAWRSGREYGMGDKVTYYITKGAKARMADWERARLVEEYDKVEAPYDGGYYVKKVDDLLKRLREGGTGE